MLRRFFFAMWCANPFVYHFDCILISKLLKVLSVVAKGAVNDHLFIAFENSFEYHPNFLSFSIVKDASRNERHKRL